MNKKCPQCGLANFPHEENCRRCQTVLTSQTVQNTNDNDSRKTHGLDRAAFWFIKRFASAAVIAALILFGVYISLLRSANTLTTEQQITVDKAIEVLSEKGFEREVSLLRSVAAYRSSDNWLNNYTGHETAYAATNFPFEIITLYETFFTETIDDTERASILLHEAQHLQGANEANTCEYVWRNKKTLGWSKANYKTSKVWRGVQILTKENAPRLFICEGNEMGDCIE
ncbi:MAG: hypothetical protein H7Z37_12275 [Pyrinomonadaceae bacterium]|nr:hypothetical protein [Pyrinomonadaceae bacterium]